MSDPPPDEQSSIGDPHPKTQPAENPPGAHFRLRLLERDDLYFWQEVFGTGGQLSAADLRSWLPLHPGGSERVVGFDVQAGWALWSIARGADLMQGATVLLRVSDAPLEPSVATGASAAVAAGVQHSAQVVDEGPLRFHPRLLPTAVAEVHMAPPDGSGARRPTLRLRALEDSAQVALLGEAGPTFAARPLFAGAPPFDELDPHAWARDVMLESHGELLVALGYAAGGARRLVAWRVPHDPLAWGQTMPLLDETLSAAESHAIERLFVDGDVFGVTLFGHERSARVFVREGSAARELALRPLAEERVVGAHAGQLLVLAHPGEIFAPKPALHATLSLRHPASLALSPASDDATGGADALEEIGSLPAGLYLHRLAFVGAGPGGEFVAYDEDASPPVLWRIDHLSRLPVVSDGARCPFVQGAESLGESARLRADHSGMYFLRALPTGLGLVRVSSLEPPESPE